MTSISVKQRWLEQHLFIVFISFRRRTIGELGRKKRLIHSKPPFGAPTHVLRYLAATPIE